MSIRRVSVIFLLAAILSACGFNSTVITPKDSAPSYKVDADSIRDAIPRNDEITRAGNKNPYTVNGKTYHLLPNSQGYEAEGIASWYGTKFQGRPTANGERYNLYAMTAAHRTLPIPAYVRVTNLENGRTTVVRVNDRGPFHEDRIIDLSYAAAVKLSFVDKGTARVRVEVIDTRPNATVAQQEGPGRYFLQVGAFKSLTLANRLRDELQAMTGRDIKIFASESAEFYRVQIGPLVKLDQVQLISDQLEAAGKGRPRLISE